MKPIKIIVAAAVLALLGTGGFWFYSSWKISSMRRRIYASLTGIQQVRGSTPLSAAMVKKRTIARLSKIGVTVKAADIEVTIVRANAETAKDLPVADRKALAIAAKLPHHEIVASVMHLRFKVPIHYGWASDVVKLNRIYLVKGIAVPTDSDANAGKKDEGDEGDEGDETSDDDEP